MKLYWKKLYKSRREKMRYLVLCMYGHVYLPYLSRIDPLMHYRNASVQLCTIFLLKGQIPVLKKGQDRSV